MTSFLTLQPKMGIENNMRELSDNTKKLVVVSANLIGQLGILCRKAKAKALALVGCR
jgi:hypothetical protein